MARRGVNLPSICRRLPVAGFWLPAVGRRIQVAGFWLLAFSSEAQVQLGDCDKAGAPSAQILKAEGALAKGDRPMAQVYMSTIRRKEPESIHGWYLDAELALLVGEERAA